MTPGAELLEEPGHTTTQFVLLGDWPTWIQVVVVLLATAVFAMAIYNYRHLLPLRRRVALLALRFLGVTLLLAIFFQPALLEEKQARSRNQIAVLVDNSESMTLPYGISTRFSMTKAFFRTNKEMLESLAKENDLSFFSFGEGLEPLANPLLDPNAFRELKAEQKKTRIVQALDDLTRQMRNRDLSGVLLFSDGLDTDKVDEFGAADIKSVERLNAPVFAFTPDDDSKLKDVSIQHLASSSFAFYMNKMTVDAEVEVLGYRSGTIVLSFSENGQELSRRFIQVLPGKTRYTVSFELVPKKLGKQVYRVEAEPMEDEIYLPNNSRQSVVHVVRDKVRVLQIVGQPSWDERFLRNHLKSDPNVDLISFFILVNPQNFRPVRSRDTALIPFPAEELFEVELGGFDLVIFQNFNYGPFQTRQYLPRIADFVRDGGGFVMVGGPRSFASGGYRGTPITDVLPVDVPRGHVGFFRTEKRDPNIDTELFRARLTDIGERHPITRLTSRVDANRSAWEGLEMLEGFNRVIGLKKDALVLLEHPTKEAHGGGKAPLVAITEAGKGRTMAVLTDSTWHWSFHAGNQSGDHPHYDEFWSNAIRWLIRDPELELVRVGLNDDQIHIGEKAYAHVQAFRSDYRPASHIKVHVEVVRQSERAADDEKIVAEFDQLVTDSEGRVEMEIPIDEAGVYRIDATAQIEEGKTARGSNILVGVATNTEFERLRADASLLHEIAKVSKGAVFPLTAKDPVLTLKPPRVVKVTRRRSHEIWTEAWVLFAIIFLFGCEWFFRRKYGYV